ncbi:MAG TPA: hypothetical protein VE996_01040 [Terriglobales bacterium]|nr:hypothetical protein [Terriglobales bacterium]
MSTASVLDLIREAEAAGIRLRVDGDKVKAALPDPPGPVAPILARLRQHRTEVRQALSATGRDDACPACGTAAYRWQDAAGWHCGKCEPNPRAARWAGVTLATLGDRAISLTPPARDLPTPREWVMTPAGLADLLCWEVSGAEGLVRLFRPRQGQPALVWFPSERIVGEIEWARKRA